MQVFWSLVAFFVLIIITYKFGYSNGKDSVEISDDQLKDDIEFLSAFAMYEQAYHCHATLVFEYLHLCWLITPQKYIKK